MCRGAIADEIEAERKKLNVPDNDWPENGAMSDVVVSDTLGFAARLARGPVSPPDLSSAFPVVGGPLEPDAEMSETPPGDLTEQLLGSLASLSDHVVKVETRYGIEGGELTDFDVALGHVVRLVPLLLEDHAHAWQVAAMAQAALEQYKQKDEAASIMRPHLIVPNHI